MQPSGVVEGGGSRRTKMELLKRHRKLTLQILTKIQLIKRTFGLDFGGNLKPFGNKLIQIQIFGEPFKELMSRAEFWSIIDENS